MVQNLPESVSKVVVEVLEELSHETEEVGFSVQLTSEPMFTIDRSSGRPKIVSQECVSVWVVVDQEDDVDRNYFKLDLPIVLYSDELLREKLARAWDALTVTRMDQRFGR